MTEPVTDSLLPASWRNIALLIVLSGGLGTGTGALSSNYFAPADARMDRIEEATKENAEQIKNLVGALAVHQQTGGHAPLEHRVSKAEARITEQEAASRAFYQGPWGELMGRLGRIEAKLDRLEKDR